MRPKVSIAVTVTVDVARCISVLVFVLFVILI